MSHNLSRQGKSGYLHCLTEKTAFEDDRDRVFFAPLVSWHGVILGVYDKAWQVIESRDFLPWRNFFLFVVDKLARVCAP